MIERMQRAAQLDVNVYNEVEQDTSATGEAFQVVLITAGASAIGSALGQLIFNHEPGQGTALTIALIATLVGSVLGWVIWSYVTYFIGTAMGGTATPGEMLRTLGYAYSPQVLNILGFIPCIGGLIVFATSIWSLVAGVIAVREALDFSTGQAVITCIIGWFVVLILTVGVALVVGAGAFLSGAFR